VYSLTRKLRFSYGLLIIIILAVGSWAIYHFVHLGRAVDVILVNNYRSIVAAEKMKEALERIDSASIFFIAFQRDEASKQFADNAKTFSDEFQIAASNITEPGEREIISAIESQFAAYRRQVQEFLDAASSKPPGAASEAYFTQLNPAFVELKDKLDNLLRLNQQAMVAASERARAQSVRAEVSTAIVAVIALLLAGGFAWRFTSYIVQPLGTLTDKARRIAEGDLDQHIDIHSKDEIGLLAAEFNRMASRLRGIRQSDYWRLLLEQKKSDAVINSIYEPVIVTDANGRVVKLNRAAEQLISANREGLHDDADVSLSAFSAGPLIMQAVQDAVRGQQPIAREGEAALVPAKVGGADRSYRMRTTPMRDDEGRMLGAVTLLEDITAIREVDKIKTEFISVASGKLREPLQSLQLALHAVLTGGTGELNEKQIDMLSDARQSAEQLEELMNDLLELAEIESGTRPMNIERLRPIDIARAAIDRFQSSAESRHVKLENHIWPDLSWVMGDRRALKSVFDNLLSNAIRHTGRDGVVKIDATERSDGRIYFSVSDTGEGIPEEYLSNLFGRFVQVGSNQAGGTGLGLALVKRLVEAQGGQISVQSRVGEGTTFIFTLLVGGPAVVSGALRNF
jgi:NtrC-family two-component system sensor histidine kinase KinB